MQQKTLGVATTVFALTCIAWLTLRPLGGPLPSGFDWCVICGQSGGADFVDNVLLFIPLGLGLRLAGVRPWPAWFAAAGLSASIETAQYWVISGRDSALGDLLANSLGGAIGIALVEARRLLLTPSRRAARRLAIAATIAVCALAAGIHWTLRPSLPTTQYWVQIASRLPQFIPFNGAVLDPTVDGDPMRDGRLSLPTTTALRTALLDGSARIAATIVPVAQPNADEVSPIVAFFDARHDEILVVGCVDSALAMRVRTHAADLRLQPPTLTAHGECTPGDTIRIAAELLPRSGGARLTAATSAHTTVATPSTGLWTGWHLLVPDLGRFAAPMAGLITALWIAALSFPVAYWSARADGEGRPTWRTGLAAALALVAPLAIIPIAAGAELAPPSVWIFSAAALVFGLIMGQLSMQYQPGPAA